MQEDEDDENVYNDTFNSAEEEEEDVAKPELTNLPIPPTSAQVGAAGFVQRFLQNSRLSFLGNWKRRYEELLDEIPPPPSINFAQPRVLLHVDLDAFFCTASLLDKPAELKQRPVAVCWCKSSESSSEISSCNYAARGFGIKAGMPLQRARELCKDLTSLPFDFQLYQDLSLEFYRTLFDFTPHVEGVSCDEAFVDVTHLLLPSGKDAAEEEEGVLDVANRLRAEICKRTRGLTASVGCGRNKMLARLCTARAKPNRVFSSIGMDKSELLNDTLPVSALHSIGRSTMHALKQDFDCETVARLATIPLAKLQGKFGPVAGKRLYQLARGEDDSKQGRWNPRPERDSISVQISWGVRMETKEQVEEFFAELCNQLMKRLLAMAQGKEQHGDAVTVKVWRAVDNQPEHMRKGKIGHGICDVLTKTIRSPGVKTNASLLACALDAFSQMSCKPESVRGLGIAVSGLVQRRTPQQQLGQAQGDGIALWFDNQAAKRQRVSLVQRLAESDENARSAIERELVYAFELCTRCDNWPECGQMLQCCGEANRMAIRNGLVPLLRGLIDVKPNNATNLLSFTRFTAQRLYGAKFSALNQLGGGLVFLNEMLEDLQH